MKPFLDTLSVKPATRPTVEVPEWIAVDLLDRLQRQAEDAMHAYRLLRDEIGISRPQAKDVKAGDVLLSGTEYLTVTAVHRGDYRGEYVHIIFEDGQTWNEDPESRVSRRYEPVETGF